MCRSEYSLGRRRVAVDKHCDGQNVSRKHLKIERRGGTDWRDVRWCVTDLGTVNGTFINRKKIETQTPYLLNSMDLLGIGCEDLTSTAKTFVYRYTAALTLIRHQTSIPLF